MEKKNKNSSKKTSVGSTPTIQSKRVKGGTVFGLISAGVAVAASVAYYLQYNQTQYFDNIAFLLPLIGAALFLIVGMIPPVAKFAPVALWVASFAGLLVYVHAVYMYLSEVFYSGVTPETIASIDPGFVITTLLYLVASILTNIAAWVKQRKTVVVNK